MVDRNNGNEVARRNNAGLGKYDYDYATRAFRDMDRFMQSWMTPFERSFFLRPFGGFGFSDRKARVYRTDEGVDVNVDLPGVSKDDVKITPDEDYLTVSVNKHEKDEKHISYNQYEERVFVGKYDPDKVTAKLDNGVLMIHVPSEEKNDGKDEKTISID